MMITSLLHLNHTASRCLVHETKPAFFSTMRNVHFVGELCSEIFFGKKISHASQQVHRAWSGRHLMVSISSRAICTLGQDFVTSNYVRLLHPSVKARAGADCSRSERSNTTLPNDSRCGLTLAISPVYGLRLLKRRTSRCNPSSGELEIIIADQTKGLKYRIATCLGSARNKCHVR